MAESVIEHPLCRGADDLMAKPRMSNHEMRGEASRASFFRVPSDARNWLLLCAFRRLRCFVLLQLSRVLTRLLDWNWRPWFAASFPANRVADGFVSGALPVEQAPGLLRRLAAHWESSLSNSRVSDRWLKGVAESRYRESLS